MAKINLAIISNLDLEINLDYSEYNEYYIENRKILNLLYIYPKIMAYYSIYYYFKGEKKNEKDNPAFCLLQMHNDITTAH
jgi:hypothetical protein